MSGIIGPIVNNPLVQQFGSDALNSATNFLVEKSLTKGGQIFGRFFGLRFFGASDEEIQVSLSRLQTFTQDLTARMDRLEQEGKVTHSRAETQFDKPEVVATLHAAFDCAVETNDPVRQRTLAEIVAQRLAAEDESLYAIATRTASAAMRDITASELRLIGLIMLINTDPTYMREINDSNIVEERGVFETYLHKFLGPMIDIPAGHLDIQHLQAIGALQFEENTLGEADTTPMVLSGTVRYFPPYFNQNVWKIPGTIDLIRNITRRANGDAREGVVALQKTTLSPMGMVIAAAVVGETVGLQLDVGYM